MGSVFESMCKRFFILTALIVAIAGCGSSSSTSSSSESNGTGSIAAKLTWSSPGAKTTAKTLYAAPAGVTLIKILVYDTDMRSLITPQDFTATPGENGSGTIAGIPAGTGRIIKVWGMDDGRIIRYQGVASNVTIVTGQTTTVPVTMSAPVTTASPLTGDYPSPLTVTLTASEPATIYYTTSGSEPTNSSTKGPSPLNITITNTSTLKFFAIDSGFAEEQVKTEIYTITP